ncbi:TY-Chap domain-containing protein [Nocardia sp. R16R-3T]
MITGVRDWPAFAVALALTLARILGDGCLIVGAPGNRFAQFLMAPDGLWAEIVANSAITDPDHHICPAEEALLIADGWNRPSDNGSLNWHRQLSWPTRYADYETLADRVAAILRDLLQVPAPSELTVQSWVNYSNDDFDTSALA